MNERRKPDPRWLAAVERRPEDAAIVLEHVMNTGYAPASVRNAAKRLHAAKRESVEREGE